MRRLDGARRARRSHRDFDTFEIERDQHALAEHAGKREIERIRQSAESRAVEAQTRDRGAQPANSVEVSDPIRIDSASIASFAASAAAPNATAPSRFGVPARMPRSCGPPSMIGASSRGVAHVESADSRGSAELVSAKCHQIASERVHVDRNPARPPAPHRHAKSHPSRGSRLRAARGPGSSRLPNWRARA